jgi:hypothetical protein
VNLGHHQYPPRRWRILLLAGGVLVIALANVDAHFVRGVTSPGLAAAFVSSLTSGSDTPAKVSWTSGAVTVDTGLSVACFHVANSSPPRPDSPGWPRITRVGFELPGSPGDFRLLAPSGSDWTIEENVQAFVAGHDVTLDFAIVARVNPTGRTPGEPFEPLGIPPGQAERRGSGTRFCVSGRFPANMTIEGIIDGVVVEFHGLYPSTEAEAGVWHPTPAGTTGPGPVPRAIPLY